MNSGLVWPPEQRREADLQVPHFPAQKEQFFGSLFALSRS